jgi:hypothetical protein
MDLDRASKAHPPRGLRTRNQIALFVERQKALRAQADREAAEQLVRHLKFDLTQRVVLLVIGVAIGIAVIVGALDSPQLLKLSLVAASAWGAISAALYRLRPRPNGSSER